MAFCFEPFNQIGFRPVASQNSQKLLQAQCVGFHDVSADLQADLVGNVN